MSCVNLCLLISSLCIAFIVIAAAVRYEAWRRSQKVAYEKEKFSMIEDVIKQLENHHKEVVEQYSQLRFQPPEDKFFIPINHLRDELIAPVNKENKKQLWEDVVQYINSKDSRVEIQTRVI